MANVRTFLIISISYLCVLALVSSCPAFAQDSEPTAVTGARKLIQAEDRRILAFACPNAPRLNRTDFDGYRKLDDGGYELTFTFKWDHGSASYFIKLGFLVTKAGKMDYVTVKDYGGFSLDAPFGPDEVTAAHLQELRSFMRKHPKVENDRKRLVEVDKLDSKELCVLYLQLQQ